MKKILFNDRYGLTQAVIDGRKTMFRQMVKPQPDDSGLHDHTTYPMSLSSEYDMSGWWGDTEATGERREFKPRYKVGEVVYLQEPYALIPKDPESAFLETEHEMDGKCVFYKLCPDDLFALRWDCWDYEKTGFWKSPLSMPASIARHFIKITGVRCQRLQEISNNDCLREGIRFIPKIDKYYFERREKDEGFYFNTPREAFASLIDKVSGRGTWNRNPWVWVYEFELAK